MATYEPAKRSTTTIFYIALVSQANSKTFQANPTLATGDFKVSMDGAALANLGTLPTVTPAGGKMVKVTLDGSTEMAGDNVTLVCSDAAGAEWCDQVINIPTTARQFDDLAFPATSGRSMVVDANGLVDANTVKLGPSGTGTAQTATDVGAIKTKTDFLPSATAGANGGVFIAGTNAATTITTALTTTFTGNLTGSVGSVTGAVGSVTGAVGSVTGAVGSVTGAVGSVTGNVGGNVTGSVGSVVGLTVANLDAAVSTRAIAGDAMALTAGERTTLTATIWAYVVTGTTTAVQAVRGFIAAMLGKASGLPTAPKYRNIADSKDVITATTDTDGNRTTVTLDLS